MNMKQITGEQAIEMILANEAIESCHVTSQVNLNLIDSGALKSGLAISIKDSRIEALYSPGVIFSSLVRCQSTEIIKAEFYGAYFEGGLEILDCTFESYADFETGGHNRKPVIIRGSKFKKFVNFADCWFKDELVIVENYFFEGTNILGNVDGILGCQFDKGYVIENNFGSVSVDGDGGKDVNFIELKGT